MHKRSDFNSLVLIADNYNIKRDEMTIFSRSIDKAYKNNVEYLIKGFQQIFKKVILYEDPTEFMKNAHTHHHDIIFPYWHGESSRNKQALVAAICETENLVYIGADTYSNIVCCDKVLSKDVCRINNINLPQHNVIRDIQDIFSLDIEYPAIIKPIYEGSSLGISQRNILRKFKDVEPLANSLLLEFKQPLMIEEFIPGKEISISLIGWGDKIKAWSAAERYHVDNDNFFNEYVHGFEEKIFSYKNIRLRDARHLIPENDLDSIFSVFSWLDKIDYIRIDGKLFNGKFYCFELSHDTSLNPNGSFFKPLQYIGFTFVDSLELIADTCLERYSNLSPNQL